MSKKHTPSFPRSCVGMQTETNPSQGMDSHAGAWEPETVPRLRFPEFRDAGEWEYKELKLLAKRISKKNKGSKETRVLTNSAAEGVIDQRDYFDKDIANKSNLEGYCVVGLGDYVYNPRISTIAPVGPISRNNIAKGVMSPLYTVFRFKSSGTDFYEQYFKSTKWHHYLRMVSNSGARHDRMSISTNDFDDMPLPSPQPNEQQKIANCLSSIDDLITAQAQKTEALKAHKKGLMQQLFPREGETVPRLRFPEFRDAGEWSYMNGDKVFDPVSNKDHNSDLPILAISQEHGAIPRDQIDYNVIVTDKSVESYKVVEIGDFIISLRSFQGGIEYSNYKGICSPAYIILRKIIDTVDSYFKYYFKTNIFIQNMNRNIEGIRDGKMVSYKQFSDLLLPITSPDEQQKIANCLSSIDDLITTQAKKIESLKSHKKGLMQQLFPSTDKAES